MIELLKLKQINLILKDINNILSNRKKANFGPFQTWALQWNQTIARLLDKMLSLCKYLL
jgi:hypothetical protein